MSVAGPRRRVRLDGDERKHQLTDACAYLIATNGYSHTSIRDVASRVGISTGTLIHHFESKQELLVATLLSVSEAFHSDARKEIEASPDPVDQLRLIVRATLASPKHDVGWRVWMAFWHEAALNPGLSSVATARNELWESLLASVILQGRAAGRLRSDDPIESASELAALINGVAVQRFGEAQRWTQERAVTVVEKLIDDWTI
jgi:AcrR family transcriptional regulator